MSSAIPVLIAPVMVTRLSHTLSFTELYAAVIAALSGVIDFRQRRIPNYLTYTTAAWALLINLAWSAALHVDVAEMPVWLDAIGAAGSVQGFGLCFLIMFFVMAATGVGAGDVKLAAALGALFGPQRGLLLICYGYILAAMASLCVALLRFGPWKLFLITYDYVISAMMFRRTPPESPQKDEVMQMSVPLGFYFALAVPLVIADLPRLVAN
ncbi:MAG: prepilin peptidase [Pirellulaceae bacterium]|nr:prepilin peptidase [Pirellulaceae bacterium]